MNRKSGRILGPFRIAFLYLGDVIGAGFASGRETWQYFGIFGKNAVSGIAIATFLFASMGVMTAYLAEKLEWEAYVINEPDNACVIGAAHFYDNLGKLGRLLNLQNLR